MNIRGRKTITIWFLMLTVVFGCSQGDEAETNQVTDTAVQVEPTDMPPTPVPTDTPLPTEEPSRDNGATIFRDIFYTSHEVKSQSLSVFFPEEAASFPDKAYPVVFMAHGWTVENENGAIVAQVIPFANELGYVVVSTDYRDGVSDGGDPWNALSDITCALAWVIANADEYGFDVNQMVAFGHSRGGTLISVLATADDGGEFLQDCLYGLPERQPLLGVITYGSDMGVSGPGLFFGSEYFASMFEQELTYRAESKEDILERSQALSQIPPLEWAENDSLTDEERKLALIFPVYWIDANDPPFLVIWGKKDADESIPIGPLEATAFVGLLESAGVPATYLLVPGASHAYLGNPLDRDDSVWQESVERFLDDLIVRE